MTGIRKKLVFTAILLILPLVSLLTSDQGNVERIHGLLALNPKDVSLWNALGIEQAKIGDLEGAVDTWSKGIIIDKTYFHLYNNIGSALRRMGHPKESADWYRAGLNVKPTYWTWFNLGLLQEEMNDPMTAIQSYKAALTLYPSFTQARENLEKLETFVERGEIKTPVTQKLDFTSETALPPVPQAKPPVEIQPKIAEKVEKRPEVKPKPKPKPALKPTGPKIEFKPAAPVRTAKDIGGPVFLTFDGGADADGIPGILAALRERRVRSTFFLTGQWVKNFPQLALQVLADGHEIANHGMTHQNMSRWSKEKISQEIFKTEQAFEEVLGRGAIKYFRFPFGAQNRQVEKYVSELGYKPVYWDIDTLDWKEPSLESIIEKLKKLKPYSVILMHCGSRQGALALPYILKEVIVRGYSPTLLSKFDPKQISAIPNN